MNADLHHQLHDLFTQQADDTKPFVPDHFNPTRTTSITTPQRPDRRRPLLAAAAAITLIAVSIAILATRNPNTPSNIPGPTTTQATPDHTTTVPTTTASTATTTTPGTTTPGITTPTTGTIPFDGELGKDPALPEVFPAFASDDAFQSIAIASYRLGGRPTGESEARALVGRLENGLLAEWVEISVHDDIDRRDRVDSVFLHPLDAAGVETVIDDVTYELHENETGLWSLVLQGEPDIAITGSFVTIDGDAGDATDFIRAAGGMPVEDIRRTADGGLTFTIGALPDGFVEIVAPLPYPWVGQAVVEDAAGTYSVATKRFSDLVLNTPDLIYRLREVDINGIRGWARDIPSGDPTDGAEDFVTWPVAPGTWATVTTQDNALDVARSVVFVDEPTWRATYEATPPADTNRPPQQLLDIPLSPERLRLGGLLFLPDGQDLLVFTTGTDLVIDGETGEVLHTFASRGAVDSSGDAIDMGRMWLPSFSPDGSRYADNFNLWDVESGQKLTDRLVGRSVFSPDSRWMATIVASDDLFLYDARTGEVLWRETRGPYGEFWFSDDSSQVFMADASGDGIAEAQSVYDVATGDRTAAAGMTPPVTVAAGFTADPALVAELDGPYGRCDPIGFWGVEPTGLATRTQMPKCVISPDGSRIAMLDAEASQILIWGLGG